MPLKRQNRRWLLPALMVPVSVCAVALLASYIAGSRLIEPSHVIVGPPPSDMALETVEFKTQDNTIIRGWYGTGEAGRGTVLLIHGIRGNRRQMLKRARFLGRHGFGVMLFDLQGHGESEGSNITFGHREAYSAAAALKYVRDRAPRERVGAIGCSLGGAATLLGDSPLVVDALVLEAVYPTIQDATSNRLEQRFGKIGRVGTRLLTWQLPLRLGIDASQLRPVDAIKNVKCPVFVIGGREDKATTAAETRRLAEAAPGPKKVWLLDGIGHVDLYAVAGQEYESNILVFFTKYLSTGTKQ